MQLMFFRYESICEPDIIEGFNELGFTVHEKFLSTHDNRIPQHNIINRISDTLMNQPVDFVFSINFFPTVSEVCKIFKIPYLCWVVDSPVMELYTASIKNTWNRVFIFDYALYKEISPFNPECIFYLPLATNVKQKYDTIYKASIKKCQKYSSELSFLGSLYTEKSPYDKLKNAPLYLKGYLDGLIESQLRIYGAYIIEDLLTDEIIEMFKKHHPSFYQLSSENYLTDRITLSQLYIGNKISAIERVRTLKLLSDFFKVDVYTGSDTSLLPEINNKGLAKTFTEMPIIFHQSKVNLNITSKSIRSGISLRIWDVLGSGGFLISNFQSEIPDYFICGEELECYDHPEELIDKVNYYIEHEKERLEIAENGYQKVKRFHTYPIRLERMLSLAYHLN